MIYATVNVTIGDYQSTFDNTIVLYRGDKNVEIRFVLKGNKFTVLNSIYAQMIITRPSTTSVFSEIAPIQNDTVILTISEDMIDELTEVGCYDIQIRLYDDSMKSRVTIPPAEKAIEVREPIAIDESFVDTAMVGYARAQTDSEDEEDKRFDENGNYIKTYWEHGDIITAGKLNKVEDSLEAINANDIQNHIDVNEKIDALAESINEAEYVTEIELNAKGYLTEHQDISGKADKTEIPTKTSQLTNDSGFLTQIPSECVTETELNAKGYLTEHQDISGKADKTELHNHSNKSILDGITASKVSSWDNKSNFDGNYNSLTNKPSIPSIEGLATENYVNEKLENTEGNCRAAYGTCSTEAATAEKAIVIEDPNWKLEVGSIITVRFSVANTASNVTLNVNGTGAYGIRTSGESSYTGSSSTYCGNANRALTYMFDGSHWQWISAGAYPSSATNVSLGQGYTTCSTAAATKAKTASLSSYTLSTGGILVVKFTYDVPAGATLNVNSKGAKAIYYKGVAITDGVIKAGDTATFIYSTRYHLISIDREIPTKTSQLTNDSDFITKHQGSENAGKILAVDNNGDIVFEEMPEGSGEGGTKSELLEFTYISTYPNQTSFEYTTTTSQGGNWLYKKSTLLGGTLSVDWNTALLTSVELIIYLFDSEGNPYRYTQRYNSYGVNETIAGDKYPVTWMQPGTGSGFCIATGPFTIKIPDNCSVMLAMRAANAVFPSGSSLNNNNFYKQASSIFSVSVIKEASVAFAKVDVIQGADNANRIMITNDKGEVVVGDINPNSMALRPNWDTVIHRGWVNGAKENTIPAFYLAKENGYSWVECDIRMSSDGVPVLAHDATITSEDGASVLTVAESTVSQLQSITLQNHERFGAIKMNTLAELLDMARCLGMKIVLDIKVGGESAMKSIAKTVLRYGMSDNVIYMPMGTTNASHIKMVDKNASFDFVMYGTDPTSTTDLTGYASLLNGSNHVNLDIQANTWEFTSTVIDAMNNVGLGLCAWNVTSENIGKCIDSGMLRITKHNNFDDVDLNTNYLKDKKFW